MYLECNRFLEERRTMIIAEPKGLRSKYYTSGPGLQWRIYRFNSVIRWKKALIMITNTFGKIRMWRFGHIDKIYRDESFKIQYRVSRTIYPWKRFNQSQHKFLNRTQAFNTINQKGIHFPFQMFKSKAVGKLLQWPLRSHSTVNPQA